MGMESIASDVEKCVGCGAEVARIAGPTHRYMLSAPGCWALFGQLLARLLSEPAAEDLRRRCADAFAVQHPGTPGRQAIQSVAGHLMSLYAQFELNQSPRQAHEHIEAVVRHEHILRWLTPPASVGRVVVRDVVEWQCSLEEIAREWARGAWLAWEPWHGQIRDWYQQLSGRESHRKSSA